MDLVRKGIELAKAGDPQMLKFLLDRILPKERSVHVNLPIIEHPSDAIDAVGKIIEAVGTKIAPSEAAALASLLGTCARILDVAELGERLDNLEQELRALKKI